MPYHMDDDIDYPSILRHDNVRAFLRGQLGFLADMELLLTDQILVDQPDIRREMVAVITAFRRIHHSAFRGEMKPIPDKLQDRLEKLIRNLASLGIHLEIVK